LKAVFRELVLIRINKIEVRTFAQDARHLEQGERGKRVVVIQHGHELTRAERQRAIGVSGDALVGIQKFDLDPRILVRHSLQKTPPCRISRVAVGNRQLPMIVCLPTDGIDRLFEDLERNLVNREDDADLRPVA